MPILFCVCEMIKYILAEYLFLSRREKNHLIYLLGLIVYFIYEFLARSPIEDKHLLVFVITVICFAISYKDTLGNRIINTAVMLLIVTSISGIEQFIYDLLISAGMDGEHTVQYFAIKDITSIVLLLIAIIIKVRFGEAIMLWIGGIKDRKITLAIAMSAFILTFTISLLEYSQSLISDSHYQSMALIGSGIAYMSIVLLVGMAVYIKAITKENREKSEQELKLIDMQRHNYEVLLEQENETRAFRHDIANHLICLGSLAEKGHMDAVTSYIDDMKGEIKRIKVKTYSTGNMILDIITNYYLPQLSENIDIRVLPSEEVELKEMEICTIYSNLLQNAVEELCAYPDRKGKLLISLKREEDKYRMMIENTVFGQIKKGLLTHKSDTRNHGYGLRNVRNVIKELGGKMVVNTEADIFRVIVELNLDMTENGVK